MSELKPLPCPFCGGAPRTVARPDNIDGTRFFYALACYCGGYSACAHKMAVEPTPEQAKRAAIEAWNRRAQPAQAGQWLPIETAPQDWGVTKFDVWANDARFADCWWGKATYEQGEPGIVYQSDYDCNGPVDSYVRNATHWMPLPPPPGIVGEKVGA